MKKARCNDALLSLKASQNKILTFLVLQQWPENIVLHRSDIDHLLDFWITHANSLTHTHIHTAVFHISCLFAEQSNKDVYLLQWLDAVETKQLENFWCFFFVIFLQAHSFMLINQYMLYLAKAQACFLSDKHQMFSDLFA